MLIRRESDVLTEKDILDIIESYDYSQMRENQNYYDGKNRSIIAKFYDMLIKNQKPNYVLPSPYYSTITNSAAAYSFNDIQIVDKSGDLEKSETLLSDINKIFSENDTDVKDIRIGVYQVGVGVAYELHYVEKDGENKYRFDIINPLECIPIYDTSISTKLIGFIHHRDINDKTYIDYYTKTRIYRYVLIDNKMQAISEDVNDYKDVPVAVYYNNYDKGILSPVCGKVKPYIDAVDMILTGNWNEIEKFADAILLATRNFKAEDKEDIRIKRILDGLTPEEAQAMRYLTKEVQWQYQEFFLKVLINEIHKHTHVIDYQNPDSGIGSTDSGKALQFRMIDMDANAKTYERLNREGQYRRLKLLQNIGAIKGDLTTIEVVYNHNIPEDVIEKMNAINNVTFISDATKQEMVGLDPVKEAERLEEEGGKNLEDMLTGDRQQDDMEEIPLDNDEDIV